MVKRKARKRKFGSTILTDQEEELFGYDTESEDEDEDSLNMGVEYQENTDSNEDIDFNPDEQDPEKRAEQAQRIINRLRGNNEENISGSSLDLGNRMHEENVNHAENMFENMHNLTRIFYGTNEYGFNLYQHSVEEKIKFTKIVNTLVFNKLKKSREKEINTMKRKIITIKQIINNLKDEKLLLKTPSFKKNIDDRVKRLNMELETIAKELSVTQKTFKKEKEEFENLNRKLITLKSKNTEQYSKKSYKNNLENIFKIALDKKTNLKKTRAIVNLSDMSVQEIQENFILKPTSEGLKLHNSVFSKYKTINIEKTSHEYNMNVYKRYNLLENLSIIKTSSKEKFFKIMGNFKLTEHMDSLTRIDKKYRRIIYDHAISLISSFVPDNKIDELLKNTSLYKTSANKQKEKKKRIYAPVIGWVYKNNALKTVKRQSNAYNNIRQGKQKFIKGTLEDMRNNTDVNFIERGNLTSNIYVKILIINEDVSVEPWRIRYIKHKLLLDQVNERKLYEMSRVKNIPFKPEKFINENILEKMAEHDIKQIHEEMDNKEKIKDYLNKIISSSNKKDIEEKIKKCAYNNFSVPTSKYNELEQLVQIKISSKQHLQTTGGLYDNEKEKDNRKEINKLHKEIVELKLKQQDIMIPYRLGYISQLSSVVDRRKEDSEKKKKNFDKTKGIYRDVRLPGIERLYFRIPKQTIDGNVKLTELEVKLIERKLLLDEMMIKKISNTINYNKFNIEDFKRFPKRHTNAVVGKDVESIIRSFQKELPTGFYTEDKEKVKTRLQDVLNKGKCSQEVKKFLLEKVVPLKGSRYNFNKILEQNKNRRSRNYYKKYLKGKYKTYEDYENDYIRQQEALFDEVKNQPRIGASFLRLKRNANSNELFYKKRDPIDKEIITVFNIPGNLNKNGIRKWFEKYFDIFPANKETEGLIQDSDYFMRDSLYVDDLRKERIKSLPARRIDAGFIKKIGYVVNWISEKQTFQFNFEKHELISYLFCHVQFMINNSNINNVIKQKRLLIVLKILYYLQENINSKTLQFFIDYENEVKMDLCTGKEFSKDTMSKIRRLIEYCEEQIIKFNITIEEKLNDMIREKLKKISIDNQISRYRLRQILNKDSIPKRNKFRKELETISELDESFPVQGIVDGESRRPVIYETRRGGPSAFDLKRTINPFTKARGSLMRSKFIKKFRDLSQEKTNRNNRNDNELEQNMLTRYQQDSKMIKYSYKQNIKKLVNLYKPKLSNYEKEYIRLWNLSGNSRKSIITDVERELVSKLNFIIDTYDKKNKIEIFRELCKLIIIPIIKDNRIANKQERINEIFDKLFNDNSGIEYGIRYNNKFLDRNIPIFEDMKKGLLREYSNVPFQVLEEYRKFDINNFNLLLNREFIEYRKSLEKKKKNIENFEKAIEDLIHYDVKTPYKIIKILLQNIKEHQNLSSITNITSKDIVINVIKKSLAKMFLENNDIEYFKIAQDLNENGLRNFKILKNKLDNNNLKRDLENYKKNITNKDIALCILKQVRLVSVSKNQNPLFGDLVESKVSVPIDISKGVEFYLNESFKIEIYDEIGELFKTTIKPKKNLKKSSIKKDNAVSLIDSVKSSSNIYKEAYLTGVKSMKGMETEILYLINRARQFQSERGIISLYSIKFRHTFNSIKQFKDFLVSHLKYSTGIKELKYMYDTEKGYEADENVASKPSRLFGKKKRKVKKKVKRKRRK